jgi:hypothetical protein
LEAPPAGTDPARPTTFWTAGVFSAFWMAPLSFSTISGGVFAGAKNIPHEPNTLNPGTCCRIRGTSGSSGKGLWPV